MSCPEFEKSGLLFISGELKKEEARSYRAHLRECTTCLELVRQYREMFELADGLNELSPGPEIRERILEAGRQAPGRTAHRKKSLFTRFGLDMLRSPWVWGIPAAAAVALMLFLNPFSRDSAELNDVLAWNDDFLVESSMIEDDIANVGILTGTPHIDEEMLAPLPGVSTLNDEFISIRKGIEDLLQEITGF